MKPPNLTRQQQHFLGVISGMAMPMAFDASEQMSERQKGFLDGVNFAMRIIATCGSVPQYPKDET